MASKLEIAERICNQMLRGISGRMPDITPEQKTAYQERYMDLAARIANLLPYNSGTIHSSLGAALCKCAIWYGETKIMELLARMTQGTFQGQNDPAKLLFLFMHRMKGLSPLQVYQKTVSAARAFCEGRTLHELRYAKTDVFNWNDDYSGPKEPTTKTWWQEDKPIYNSGGSFRIFARQIDGQWEYVITRKAEIIMLNGNQVVAETRPPSKKNQKVSEVVASNTSKDSAHQSP